MVQSPDDTSELVRVAADGDQTARDRLFGRFRERLRRMVSVRLDRRLNGRVDPSDIVQEALAEAAARLPGYARKPDVTFYPWLRRLAWQRLSKLHRDHLRTQRRSVLREQRTPDLSDESVLELSQRLAAVQSSPSEQIIRGEVQRRVRTALEQLSDNDREVLMLRYLEQLPLTEIAEVVGAGDDAIRQRHARALLRLKTELERNPS